MASKPCCHKSFYSRIDGTFPRHFWTASSFQIPPGPPKLKSVYKVGLINEHLVRVWKSGEDVREKKLDSEEKVPGK